MNTRQIDAGGPTLGRARAERVDEERRENLHRRRLHLQSGVVPASLSESDSKALLGDYGIPFCREIHVGSLEEALESARTIGYPVVLKANSPDIAHKSELGLVTVGIRSDEELIDSFGVLVSRLEGKEASYLVSEMVKGSRELIVGMVRDEVCGPFALLGLGGVVAEALRDMVLIPLPAAPGDVSRGLSRLRSRSLFDDFRGDAPLQIEVLERVVSGLGRLAITRPDVTSVDLNPFIVLKDGNAVAVDALVVMEERRPPEPVVERRTPLEMKKLFDPRGIVVVGASTHPGKFGFVSLHNITVNGYGGALYGLNQSGESVLDAKIVTTLDEIPVGAVDLAFFCTPSAVNENLLRQCADRGIGAAFVASAGYRESGVDGAELERRLVATADELGIVLGGPNGQGLVSTPSNLCAQIVAPYPPAGSLSIASQSGNFVSTFLNMSVHSGVGVARAVSAGNSAQINVGDYLNFFVDDDATSTTIAYVESISDGPRFLAAVERHCRTKPLILIRGGRTDLGKRAASSHTGAMASDYLSFAAKCESLGACIVDDPEAAFDVGAAFSTLPVPRGGRLAILTTVGGWGVVTSDVVHDLESVNLVHPSEELLGALDDVMPVRWSRGNPLDCAGGETRETVPTALEILCSSGEVDVVLLLGLGIQGNQARMMKHGGMLEQAGLQRIVAYHERQEERYVDTAVELARSTGVPVLMATELAVADRENSAIRRARERCAHVFPSGPRAVRALDHLVRYARFRTGLK
jgi:acetyltransferase